MSEIALRWDALKGLADWTPSAPEQLLWTDEDGNAVVDQDGREVSLTLTPGEGLAAGDDLLTAVLISLFTDAAASGDDVVADRSDDPRGWWGGEIGSKLWLRARSKKVSTTLALVRHDIEVALAWLVQDGVAASVDVDTAWGGPQLLVARVLILRRDGSARALAFSRVWDAA